MSFKKAFSSKYRAELKMKAKDTETRKAKTQKHKNLVLPKEQVENADLCKPVLNKIMITREFYIKYNFVAPLEISIEAIENLTCKKQFIFISVAKNIVA